MRADALAQTLNALIDAKMPVFIWGAPGIGKSSIVKQVARKRGLDFLDLRLSLLDPTDLKGIPFFDAEKRQGVWAPPSFLPSDPDSKGILFLDEINTAAPSVQASAYQLILDRAVGEYRLPDGWAIVAAGNRETDRGVIYRMPSPLANRFVHLELEVDLETWKRWAYAQAIDASIIAFLAYDSSMLFRFDPSENLKAFPTPRSWEYVDRILKAGIERERLKEAIAGAVGEEASVAFLSFRSVMTQLPDFDAILRGESVEVDEDAKVLTATVIGLVNRLGEEAAPEKIAEALSFSFELPPEFAVMLVKEIQSAGIDTEAAANWETWVERFAYLLA